MDRAAALSGWIKLALGALVLALATALPARAEPFAKGLLWRLSKPGVPASHVFGTIHLADPRALEIADPVLEAFDRSRSFAMESAQLEYGGSRMLEAAQFEDGRSLESVVGAETAARARKALAPRGVPEALLARLKPWAALLNIAVTPEDYADVTLDQRLFARARARRMEIRVLEGLEEQIAIFEALPLPSQVAMLRHTLEHRDWLVSMIEPTLQAWLKRDLAGLRAVNERIASRFPTMTPHYRVFARRLVDDRSLVMAHRLHVPLRSGRVFVAVGATHLYGETGMLRLIQKQGYRVTRVY